MLWVYVAHQVETGATASFTRVVVADLKPEVLAQLVQAPSGSESGGAGSICCDLAHLYHYYLHGADGNTFW